MLATENTTTSAGAPNPLWTKELSTWTLQSRNVFHVVAIGVDFTDVL